MAMNMQDYFRLRCTDTLEALDNMTVVFSELQERVKDELAHEHVQMHLQTLQNARDNMAQLIERYGKVKPSKMKMHNGETERVVVVGRLWVGTQGQSTIEHYRVYAAKIPAHLVAVNAAMLSEEVTHFNLGNYTGLIVLAKELGDQQAAEMLQSNIDHEHFVRTQIEGTLWKIVQRGHQQEMAKAA